MDLAALARSGIALPEAPLEVRLAFFNRDKRRHDLDNMASSVLDLMVDAGLIVDDTCLVVKSVQLSYQGVDKEKPRVEVIVRSAAP